MPKSVTNDPKVPILFRVKSDFTRESGMASEIERRLRLRGYLENQEKILGGWGRQEPHRF